jgi:hypothetical protein
LKALDRVDRPNARTFYYQARVLVNEVVEEWCGGGFAEKSAQPTNDSSPPIYRWDDGDFYVKPVITDG